MGLKKGRVCIQVSSRDIAFFDFKPKFLRDSRGMSIAEVLVSLAMVGILAMALASLIQTMSKTQNQNNIVNTIESIRTSIQRSITDGVSWGNTVTNAGNPALTCIRNATACNVTTVIASNATDAQILAAAGIINIPLLQDGSDNTIVDNTAATQGFTSAGAPCNTWSAAGNDACPIRFDIRAVLTCAPGLLTCRNPMVEVFGILRYSPLPTNPFRSIINNQRYRVRVARGSGANFKSENLTVVKQAAGGGVGGGICTVATPAVWTTVTFSNITINEVQPVAASLQNTNTEVRLPAGTYSCSGLVTCFSCGSLKGRIIQVGGGAALGNSVAILVNYPFLGQAIIPTTTFTLAADSNIQLQQQCSASPPNVPDVNYPATQLTQYGMGMAMPDYTNTIFSSLNCVRTF
jgi:type II secretory pathway pseudopilin PulG